MGITDNKQRDAIFTNATIKAAANLYVVPGSSQSSILDLTEIQKIDVRNGRRRFLISNNINKRLRERT